MTQLHSEVMKELPVLIGQLKTMPITTEECETLSQWLALDYETLQSWGWTGCEVAEKFGYDHQVIPKQERYTLAAACLLVAAEKQIKKPFDAWLEQIDPRERPTSEAQLRWLREAFVAGARAMKEANKK